MPTVPKRRPLAAFWKRPSLLPNSRDHPVTVEALRAKNSNTWSSGHPDFVCMRLATDDSPVNQGQSCTQYEAGVLFPLTNQYDRAAQKGNVLKTMLHFQ